MKNIIIISAITILLQGCASSVKQLNMLDGHQIEASNYHSEKGFNQVTLELNDEAKAKLADNLKFNPEQLKSTITRALEARSLVKQESEYKVNIVITDIRVRSNFSAIMFGFMAGSDSVAGRITVYDINKNPIKSFDVSADYALGGLGGGQDEARMGWMYEKFTEHVLNELSKNNKFKRCLIIRVMLKNSETIL